jgi:hypothetical protein
LGPKPTLTSGVLLAALKLGERPTRLLREIEKKEVSVGWWQAPLVPSATD